MNPDDKRKSDAAPGAQMYTLKITPLHARSVHRIVELLGNQSLADLHDVIKATFALDEDAPWAFFLSDDPNDPGHGPHQQSAQRGPRARLSTLGLKGGRRFLFACDHTEDPLHAQRHEVHVLGVGPAGSELSEYPRIIESVGAPPPPPGEEPPPALDEDLKELAAEIAAAVAAFEEAELDEEQRPKKQVIADGKLLSKLAKAVAARPEQIEAISHATDTSLFDWISDVPFALAEYGLIKDAEALCQELAAVCYRSTLLGARAMILARGGRKEEALAQVRENLKQAKEQAAAEGEPVDLEILDESAEVLVELGELVQAEALTRQVLTALEERLGARVEPAEGDEGDESDEDELAMEAADAQDDALLFGDALQRLSQILRRCGRTKEAQEIDKRLAEHAAMMEQMMELEDEADLMDAGFPVPPDMLEAFADVAPEKKLPAKKPGK